MGRIFSEKAWLQVVADKEVMPNVKSMLILFKQAFDS